MKLMVNLRHLEDHKIRLVGPFPVEDLDLETKDEMIQARQPLEHDLDVERFEGGLLARGWLRLRLDCQCVRCLKPFVHELKIEDWTALVPLEGEEAAPVVNDCVDLTPYAREDILLEFPQHPLCAADCGGLHKAYPAVEKKASGASENELGASPWAELNKLKF